MKCGFTSHFSSYQIYEGILARPSQARPYHLTDTTCHMIGSGHLLKLDPAGFWNPVRWQNYTDTSVGGWPPRWATPRYALENSTKKTTGLALFVCACVRACVRVCEWGSKSPGP